MSSFRLHSTDSDFNTRVDALFSSLQTAAHDLEPQLKRKHEDDDEQEEEGTEYGRERQSFRRPQGRPPQWRGRGGGRGRGSFGPRNSTPDYIKNPHNWTRYNMRDTRVLSDSENRRVGERLLADLEARPDRDKTADQNMDCDEDDSTHHKIIFKKPSASSAADTKGSKSMEQDEEQETEEEMPNTEFVGSKKFVMQEYVVGKTKPKSKDRLASQSKVAGVKETTGKKEVKLSYLMFEEED